MYSGLPTQICLERSPEIIFHYRLLQDTDYSSLCSLAVHQKHCKPTILQQNIYIFLKSKMEKIKK